MHVPSYLQRIGLRASPPPPTLETLRRLQLAHLLHVPFENLDVLARRPISLTSHALFEKIVLRRRGGFCYELNQLFALLLEELGFDPVRLSAGVYGGDGREGREFDHLCLLLPVEGRRWLVDVGFGDAYVQPLDLDQPGIQSQNGVEFRLRPDAETLVLESRRPAEDWKRGYRVYLRPRRIEEFLGEFILTQRSPSSWFTWRRLVTRLTPTGRVTLSEDRLLEREGEEQRERRITDPGELREVLRERFGLVVPE